MKKVINWTPEKVEAFNQWKPDIKTFDTGATRTTDADDTRFDLLPSKALELASRTLAQGEAKYGERNWEKGMPTTDILNHAIRHIYKWLAGNRDEPHLTHALVNLMFAAHFEYTEETELHHEPQLQTH